ncbi:MAG: hypothetical protein ACQEP8_03710 [Chlamydiota bacterium]
MKECFAKSQRLSKSLLRDVMRDTYTRHGLKAWTVHKTPFYLTSGPLIAIQYAKMVAGFLEDLSSELDFDHPLYLMDLGAGTGRFAYLFLKELLALKLWKKFKGLRFCLVMTDIVTENIESWRKHPLFQEYLQQGVLDFAYFDGEDSKGDIWLSESQSSLNSDTIKNPVVAIANYFFDTLDHDCFYLSQDNLQEGLVSVYGESLENLAALECHLEYHSVDNNYYSERLYNEILEGYLQGDKEIAITFPLGGFRVIDRLVELSNKKLLVLAADHGVVDLPQIKAGMGSFELARHGTVSIPVNFHAFGQYIEHRGGYFFAPSSPGKDFTVVAAMWGGEPLVTDDTFRTGVEAFEPLDYWRLANTYDKQRDQLELYDILTLLKLGGWDPVDFCFFYPQIKKCCQQDVLALDGAIDKIWGNYFPVGTSSSAMAQLLAELLMEMGDMAKAQQYWLQT